jgi:hypothetical protein
MFSQGLEKIAGVAQGLVNSATKVLSNPASRAGVVKAVGTGAIGGAAVGAMTNKDENGNAAPISGALKGAAGGAVAGGVAGVGKGMMNRSRLAGMYRNNTGGAGTVARMGYGLNKAPGARTATNNYLRSM